MPESMTATLIVFYTVFLSQIYLISIHYPRKLAARINYVLTNFPPAEYPKLYPSGQNTPEVTRFKLGIYKVYNTCVALIGAGVLVAMLANGYRPSPKGGDEIFVMIYFMMQVIPLIVMSVSEMRQYKHMRATYSANTRKADLSPRRLFDYIAPGYVVSAVILYFLWLAFFLIGNDFGAGNPGQVIAASCLITGMNIAYMAIITFFIRGKRLDPYKGSADRNKQIEATVKGLVLSSIGVSIFMMATQAADQYALETFDPVLASFYMQLCIIFGIGLTIRTEDVKKMDFEVYKDDASNPVS
ncbi:hypothetical protein [Kordiimonas sp.]|uniref:hypothetical protein n=2 Tax=Kordiimonas sp. TaxID=1970157 RepID=UPI003A931AEC